jgi:hypothetical protein
VLLVLSTAYIAKCGNSRSGWREHVGASVESLSGDHEGRYSVQEEREGWKSVLLAAWRLDSLAEPHPAWLLIHRTRITE